MGVDWGKKQGQATLLSDLQPVHTRRGEEFARKGISAGVPAKKDSAYPTTHTESSWACSTSPSPVW